ncbi:colanic acid biosynthesis glycosyltransferase WcaL, partial [Candidatus Bathyarchaeota archaeon]
MKIAFIVTGFPTLSETFILNQITGLLDMGHDVEIFAQFNPEEKKVHPDVEKYQLMNRVHYFNMPHNKVKRILKAIFLIFTNFHKSPIKIVGSLNVFKYGKTALSLGLLYTLIPFLDKKFDIIHCHFGPNGIIGVHLKEIGIPGKYLTSFHGYDVNSYPKIMGKNVYNVLFKNGDLFTANTNFTKQQVVKLGCDEEKIIILPVGLRVEKFKFSTRKIQPREPIKIL